MTDVPVKRFPALEDLAIVQHGFTLRVPGLDVKTDRATALERISGYHQRVLQGLGPRHLRIAEQIHGNGVAVVDRGSSQKTPGVDALVTNDPEVVLGIYVADCCAIYFVDPVKTVIGIAHSGRKGTEQNIAGMTLERMVAGFGSSPEELVVQLSPCIRPPFYEVDFAAQIVTQLQAGGVRRIYDCGENTGANLELFYSYRVEKGLTGRMLGFLTLTKGDGSLGPSAHHPEI
ncbi:MAG: laccase domain-containing protein [Verrucomicrobia bacterium]|nr:laccase domain-containing protein [Verrucomicrobiota bacterium]MBV8274551.1 laccase domain-containing protein [Verrucomicrobiota bacterium]